jgi:hypothetical protein
MNKLNELYDQILEQHRQLFVVLPFETKLDIGLGREGEKLAYKCKFFEDTALIKADKNDPFNRQIIEDSMKRVLGDLERLTEDALRFRKFLEQKQWKVEFEQLSLNLRDTPPPGTWTLTEQISVGPTYKRKVTKHNASDEIVKMLLYFQATADLMPPKEKQNDDNN